MPATDRRNLFLLALCAAALLAALVLWLRPVWLVSLTGWDEERWQVISFFTVVACGIIALVTVLWGVLTFYLRPTDFSHKKDIIQLIAQTLGGATLIITLFSTWQGVRENEAQIKQAKIDSETTLRIAQLTLDETRQRQLAERYSRAADQLGNKDRATRIAAIYALGQLASDSDEFYWPIIQMLTSYVSENSVWKGDAARPADQISSDVQAAMNVLARRKKRWHPSREAPPAESVAGQAVKAAACADAHPPRAAAPPAPCRDNDVLELRGLDLRGLILKNRDGDLASGAHFEGAKLDRVRLDGGATNLRGIHLEHAVLFRANLRGAYLAGAYLHDVDLGEADIGGADFSGAKDLTAAEVMRATNYECAKLDEKLRAEVEAIQGRAFNCTDNKK